MSWYCPPALHGEEVVLDMTFPERLAKAEAIKQAEHDEIAHIMTCRKVGCTRCADETPPHRRLKESVA